MKKHLTIFLFASLSFCAFSQNQIKVTMPQIVPGKDAAETINLNEQVQIPTFDHRFNAPIPENQISSMKSDTRYFQIDSGGINLRNIQVHRSPQQVLITKDDQYACVRCFLSNTIEVIRISTGEIVRSFVIPSPHYFSLSHDGTKLIVASLTSEPFPDNPPMDDCSSFIIGLNGKSILTTIDIASLEIFKTDTINTQVISRLIQSLNDSIIYLQGKEVIEYNLASSSVIRRWPFTQQIWHSDIDNKNRRIFLTTIDSAHQMRLKAIDLSSGEILTAPPYYTTGEWAVATYLGIDTLSNRIFVQGKYQPYAEILVFDAISLNQLTPVDSAFMNLDCFLICPESGSIYTGAAYPNNTIELDYQTLKRKSTLPLPIYTHWHTLLLNNDKTRIYSFQYGSSEDALSFINPPQYLDLTEYDIKTGNFSQYKLTDQKYGCSYTRTLAITQDGRYILATNSPENTVSIFELPQVGVSETPISNLLNCYPNPTTGLVTVSLNKASDSDYNVQIYNDLGVLLLQITKAKSETNFTIDISEYPTGQFFVHINSDNQSYIGKVTKVKR